MSASADAPGEALPDLSKFRVIKHLGGCTYRARRLGREDIVALKVFEPGRRGLEHDHLADCVSRARELDHPNLVGISDVVADSGRVVVVSEMIEGEPLGRVLQRNVRMKPDTVLALLEALASGLAAASRAGVVHGALHPNEILLAPSGPKITAVGLDERLPAPFSGTEESTGRFSPYTYAAPEVISDSAGSEAADIFSLGAMAFHMLTGHPPYTASSLSELKLARMEGNLRWPRGAEERIPVDLILLVEDMCAPRRDRRLVSYREIRSKIGLLRGRPVARPGPREMPAIAPEADAAAAAVPGGPAAKAVSLSEHLGERKGPVMALASVAAFVLVVVMGLRQFASGPETPPGEPPSSTQGDPDREPPQNIGAIPEPLAPSPVELACKRVKDCELLLAEEPENLEPVRRALSEIAKDKTLSPWDLRAQILLDKIRMKEDAEGRDRFDRVAKRAGDLLSELRLAEAISAWKEFPKELRGTKWHARAEDERFRLERSIPDRYAEIDSRAQMYLARGELSSAKSEYRRVVRNFGFKEYEEKAKAATDRIDLAEEREVARRQATKKMVRTAGLKSHALAAIAEAFSYASSFKYDRAIGVLDDARKRLKAEMPLAASKLEQYRGAVSSEKDLFESISRRYETGQAEASATVHATGQSFAIHKLRADGLVLVMKTEAGEMETRMPWDKLGPDETFKIFSFGALELSVQERMALAVFCFHHGLLTEETNELTVATNLDRVRSGRVAGLRKLFDELREDLGETVRRRATPE